MILGMSLALFTAIHVGISLIGIASGFIVLLGMLRGRALPAVNALFLITTVLTSLTGFLFPFKGITPGIVVGILSIVVLVLAIAARYMGHLAGGWRGTYVVTATIALYFNVFVFVVQSFEKVPSLHALAPTQTEMPFKLAQLAVLVLFIAAGVSAFRRFRPVL